MLSFLCLAAQIQTHAHGSYFPCAASFSTVYALRDHVMLRGREAKAKLVCTAMLRPRAVPRGGIQPHADQVCDFEAWDARVGAQYVVLHINGPNHHTRELDPYLRDFFHEKGIQHISWFIWTVTGDHTNIGGCESSQFLEAQMTFGSGYDRYAWMIKMWPVIYGTSSPQFALSPVDWIYYFFVYCWCQLMMLRLPPLVVAYVIAAVQAIGFIIRHRYLMASTHRQLITTLQTWLGGRVSLTAHDETEGIVDARPRRCAEMDGARRVVTSTIGVKRMELQQVEAVLLVRLKTDLKALLRFLLVVVLLVMIGTYFLYLTTAPPVQLAPH